METIQWKAKIQRRWLALKVRLVALFGELLSLIFFEGREGCRGEGGRSREKESEKREMENTRGKERGREKRETEERGDQGGATFKSAEGGRKKHQ